MHRFCLFVAASALTVTACASPPPRVPPPAPKAEAPLQCRTPTDALPESLPEGERAFEPIDDDVVPSMVGKTVFAGRLETSDVNLIAGEPLTLCKAEEFDRKGSQGGRYNYVTVKNLDGEIGKVQIGNLSSRPLKYDLRHPGDAQTLLANAFHEAKSVASRLDALHAKHSFSLIRAGQESSAEMRRDYAKADALRKSFDGDATLVHHLTYGSNVSKESLLRSKAWVARFGDPALLDVYVRGLGDGIERKRYEPFNRCLASLVHAVESGNMARGAEEEKTEKSWRSGMTGVAPAQLEALDKENVERLDKAIASYGKRRQEQLAWPECNESSPISSSAPPAPQNDPTPAPRSCMTRGVCAEVTLGGKDAVDAEDRCKASSGVARDAPCSRDEVIATCTIVGRSATLYYYDDKTSGREKRRGLLKGGASGCRDAGGTFAIVAGKVKPPQKAPSKR